MATDDAVQRRTDQVLSGGDDVAELALVEDDRSVGALPGGIAASADMLPSAISAAADAIRALTQTTKMSLVRAVLWWLSCDVHGLDRLTTAREPRGSVGFLFASNATAREPAPRLSVAINRLSAVAINCYATEPIVYPVHAVARGLSDVDPKAVNGLHAP